MASKSLRVRYRPIRVGWCVEDGNLNEFRRGARLTHTLSGGKFNPIIPMGSDAARALVENFRVDLLFPIETTDASLRFVESFPHLATPLFEQKIFDNFMGRMEPNFLDISHWLDDFARELGKPEASSVEPGPASPELNRFGLIHWTQGDPLEDVLLATFGAYPPPMGIGRDYVRFIIDNLRPAIYDAKPEEPIPPYLLKQITASFISTLDLKWDRIPSNDSAGFYAGRSDNFADLVNYWNLRAADINVLFLDPNHLSRLAQLRDDHIQFMFRRDINAEFPRTINVWSREQELAAGVGIHPSALPTFFAVDGISSIKPGIRPPLHYFRNRSVLGSVSEDQSDPTLAIQLPEKPFDAHEELSQQHLVVSVDPPIENTDSEHTLWTPHIPALNHWYGRQLLSKSRAMRVETEGFGVISSITDESLEVSLIKRLDLARRLFEYVGIEAQPSVPGRIASR